MHSICIRCCSLVHPDARPRASLFDFVQAYIKHVIVALLGTARAFISPDGCTACSSISGLASHVRAAPYAHLSSVTYSRADH